MGRPSSLHEGFANVKTLMGLERFEVDKTRAFSLDFPEILEITEILEMRFTKEGNHGNTRNPGNPGNGV